MLGKVADSIAEVAGNGVASARRNARHTANLFRDLAALAVGRGVPLATYALKEVEVSPGPAARRPASRPGGAAARGKGGRRGCAG